MPAVNDFTPQAPRYDIMEAVADGNFPASGLAAGTTTIACGWPSTGGRLGFVRQCTFASQAVIVAATSATMQAYIQTGATRLNLTGTQNVLAAGGLVANTAFQIPILAALTLSQRVIPVGSLLLVDLVIVGAVTVQFGANSFVFEVEVKN